MSRRDFGPVSRPSGQAEIQARLDAITGPWSYMEQDPDGHMATSNGLEYLRRVRRGSDGSIIDQAVESEDAILIARTPPDMAGLLAAVQRLNAALLRYRFRRQSAPSFRAGVNTVNRAIRGGSGFRCTGAGR